jgi:hypothetical protein
MESRFNAALRISSARLDGGGFIMGGLIPNVSGEIVRAQRITDVE